MLNTDHFICYMKKSNIETKLKTTSFYSSINILYKLDTGRNNNGLPFCIFKILFLKAANKGVRQPKICKLKIIHNEKEKKIKFFVVQIGSPAVLGMPDIDKLGLISLIYDTTHRQVAADDSRDNSESQFKKKVGKASSLKVKNRKQKHKENRMQTINQSHLLSLIQWSRVTITTI